MKTKRTLFSMILFLSVFCLSILLEIERPFFITLGNQPISKDTQIATLNPDVGTTSSDTTAFTYDGSETVSYNNKLYQSRGMAAESSSDVFEKDTTKVDVSGSDNNLASTSTNILAESSSSDATSLMGEDPDQADTSLTAESQAQADFSLTDEDRTSADSSLTNKNSVQTDTSLAAEETIVQMATPSKYAHIGVAVANSYVNIRQEANTESDILGKLYRDSAAEILNTVGDWYYVESGSVKGYIKADYLKTGIPDDELIEKYGVLRIIVNVDGLNVRKDPDTESERLTVIYQNEKYPVVDLQEEWIKVDITDENVIGYVKLEHIELTADFKKAVSKKEEQELLRLQEEERIKQETAVKYRDEVDYTYEELKLLSCLVHSEAGNQSYEGRLAVANVVLNRVKSSKYPNTVKSVIYQPGQFSVASSGSLAKQLAKYDNYSSNSQLLSIKAARGALKGANNIGTRLCFNSYKAALKKGYDSKSECVKLEDQLFW